MQATLRSRRIRFSSVVALHHLTTGPLAVTVTAGGPVFFYFNTKEGFTMNQRNLNRAVARKTGESISTIASRGFSLVGRIPIEPGIRPLEGLIDWDYVDATRNISLLPDKQQRAA